MAIRHVVIGSDEYSSKEKKVTEKKHEKRAQDRTFVMLNAVRHQHGAAVCLINIAHIDCQMASLAQTKCDFIL